MRIGKSGAGIFLAAVFIVSRCFALVFSVIQYEKNINPQEGPQNVMFWADDHYAGTKEANNAQLKKFIESLPSRGRTHLIIESKFFYQYNCQSSQDYDALIEKLNGNFFYQSTESTTWIAWDLPMALIKIFNNQSLPSSIKLNERQRGLIKQNITVDFVDPRLQLEYPNRDAQEVLNLKQNIEQKFVLANNYSPKNIKNTLSSYVSTRFSDTSVDAQGPSSYDHFFDIEALSSIVKTFYNSKGTPPKIIVLCGAWHAYHLDKVMPYLKLDVRKEFKLVSLPQKFQCARSAIITE
jgi:hypothetical protein